MSLPFASKIYLVLPCLRGHHWSCHHCLLTMSPLLRSCPSSAQNPARAPTSRRKKNLESLLSRTQGPSMISALSPTAPLPPTLFWLHSTLHWCSNTWHDPTPGPMHMLFPLPGIFYLHTLPKSPNLALSYHPGFSSVISSPERPPWPE